jgi:tRNA threonylcarbamoyladenosine dehydratase
MWLWRERRRARRGDDPFDFDQSAMPVTLHQSGGDGEHEQAAARDRVSAELRQWTEADLVLGPRSQRVGAIRVCVVGLGGVGSHCAMVLARAGVGELRLVDFDQVTLSSLNRHAVADRSDVGLAKVFVMQRHIAQSCGAACRVDARLSLLSASNAAALLCEPHAPDVVVDCIDNVETKAHLIEFCVRRGIRVVVCTGSGARLDPAPLLVNDLKESHTDPLIRAIRALLRKERDVGRGVSCVASDEVPVAVLMPVPDEAAAAVSRPGELAVLPNFRVRIMPVYSPVPCAFGSALALQALRDVGVIGDAPLSSRASPKQLAALKQRLSASVVVGELTMTSRDVEAAFAFWRGRHSLLPDASPLGLAMARWRLSHACDRDNVVLLSGGELKAHVHALSELKSAPAAELPRREAAALERLYGAAAVAAVDARLAEARVQLDALKRCVF